MSRIFPRQWYSSLTTPISQWAQLIDVYMSDEYKDHWPDIVELAWSDAPDAFEKLKKYALEG